MTPPSWPRLSPDPSRPVLAYALHKHKLRRCPSCTPPPRTAVAAASASALRAPQLQPLCHCQARTGRACCQLLLRPWRQLPAAARLVRAPVPAPCWHRVQWAVPANNCRSSGGSGSGSGQRRLLHKGEDKDGQPQLPQPLQLPWHRSAPSPTLPALAGCPAQVSRRPPQLWRRRPAWPALAWHQQPREQHAHRAQVTATGNTHLCSLVHAAAQPRSAL